MNEEVLDRIDRLKKDYSLQPCGRKHAVSVDELSESSAVFSKAVESGDCVIDFDGSQKMAVQGGVIPIVADFAGVYLARMHSSGRGITPLTHLDERYFRPFIFGVDQRIVVKASVLEITVGRYVISVTVENEKGELKGRGQLRFAQEFRNF